MKSTFYKFKYLNIINSLRISNSRFAARRVKFQIQLLVLVVALILLMPSSVYAHILATDKSIGAVLHVNPNDEPIANRVATFVFEFKDRNNKFQSTDCDCSFAIKNNGKTIYSQPLFQDDTTTDNHAAISYTFATPDVYQIIAIGKPRNKTDFQPFTLSWDIRVDTPTTQQDTPTIFSPRNILFTTIIFGCIIFGSIICIKRFFSF